MSEQAGDEDYGHETMRRLVFLHCDVASTQAGNCLAVHSDHSGSGFRIGSHGWLDGYDVRCARGREDGQAVKTDVDQLGITGGEAGELSVVLQVAYQGVLVIIVHMGDDALLRCFICVLGGFVPHSGCSASLRR